MSFFIGIYRLSIKALRGKWIRTIIATLLLMAIIIAQMLFWELFGSIAEITLAKLGIASGENIVAICKTIIQYILTAIGFLIISTVVTGIMKWYYEIASGNTEGYIDIFYYFKEKRLIKTLWVITYILIRVTCAAVILIGPGIVLGMIADVFTAGNTLQIVLKIISVMMLGIGIIFFIFRAFRQMGSIFYYIDSEDTNKVREKRPDYQNLLRGYSGVVILNATYSLLTLVASAFLLPLFVMLPILFMWNSIFYRFIIEKSIKKGEE